MVGSSTFNYYGCFHKIVEIFEGPGAEEDEWVIETLAFCNCEVPVPPDRLTCKGHGKEESQAVSRNEARDRVD